MSAADTLRVAPAAIHRYCGGACRWLIAATVVAVMAAAPIVALVVIATSEASDAWPGLIANVLPVAIPETASLIAGVGVLVVAIGTSTAWVVARHDFPGRRVLDWALLLPLAIPTYVVAYAYLDILHPIGPVQSAIRAMLGVDSPRDLRLPDVRSLPGAIVLLSLVLYPYVYLSTKAMFVMQAGGFLEAARTLGAGRVRTFFRVALPLARPAVVAGTSLALLETLNDVGASEFLGVRTLTLSIYATWINRSDLAGAAGLALVMLAAVVILLAAERWARRHQRYAGHLHRQRPMVRTPVTGAAGWALAILVALPAILGFVVPAAFLAWTAFQRLSFAGLSRTIVRQAIDTFVLSAVATVGAIVLGLVLAYAARIDRGRNGSRIMRTASLGYALPGTVLAIGMLGPMFFIDNAFSDMVHSLVGGSQGLLITGTGAGLAFAYVVRFLTVSAGGIETGFARVPLSLDGSARTLGRTATQTLFAIHLPLIRPAIAAAAALVFVECMKELPLTLLLRPLNIDTLSTHVFAEAARGTYEDGAVAALAIVLVGLVPVILLSRFSQAAGDALLAEAPGAGTARP